MEHEKTQVKELEERGEQQFSWLAFSIVMLCLACFVMFQVVSTMPSSMVSQPLQWNASRVGVIVMVKNEERILGRLLDSVAPFAERLFVCDTGSTDAIKDVVGALWKKDAWRFQFIGHFHNFETSRNLCMDAARSWIPKEVEWLLLPDADFTLARQPGLSLVMPSEFDLNIMQIQSPHNALPLLVRANTFFSACRYRLWTHEVLDCCNDATTTGYFSPLYWVDHSDGASRPGKLVRDINLLEEWLYHYNKTLGPTEQRRPDLYARALYYLARAHEDAGHPEQALQIYRQHQLNQPWTNYQFQGAYRTALIKLALFRATGGGGGDWRSVESAFLDAYGGPDGYFRREVLYYLMWMCQELHQWNRCILYAAAGLAVPPVDHSRMPLFLEPEKYDTDLFQRGLDHCVHQSKNSPLGQ